MGEYVQAPEVEAEFDLVVIGGGPTGLLSAVLAEQLGASVCVIGRADALNARTQQYLEIVGVLDGLLPKGIKCNKGSFKSRQSHWWTSLEYCFHRNFLMIGQPEVEKELLSQLEGNPVRYGEKVVSISETGTGVTVATDLGRTVRGKYAIAADGARSTVRSALNISFTGTKPEMVWMVLDTFIDTDFPGETTQERAEDSIREHLAPYRVDFVKTEWFSTFDVRERIASTFVSNQGTGRIILAGDAAHVHSVNGGQGLNTGIADAFALSWRVITAIKCKKLAPGAALDLIRSYDTERRQVAQGVIDVAARLVRDTVHTAKQYVATIEKNAGYITGKAAVPFA
ncbi:hypothetical protein DL768_002853 [Monosporascus sp. mg162]|nr:hypothetical protein DL768_002853 [Monosporascus sp. mg162]